MKIIKRNGSEEIFNIEKIVNAISKANEAEHQHDLTKEQIKDIAEYVEYKCNKMGRAVSVEEIQDMVENQIMSKGALTLQGDMSSTVTQGTLSERQTPPTTRYFPLLNVTTRKSSRKIPTKTR